MRSNIIYKSIQIIFLLTLPFVSCTKDKIWPEREFKKAIDAIEGYYELKDVIWKGPAVDINNDGESETEFLKIFDEYAKREIWIGGIRPDAFENSQISIPIELNIPSQFLSRWNNNTAMFDCFVFATYIKVQSGEIKIDENLKLKEYISDEIQKSPNFGRLGEERKFYQTGYAQFEVHLEIPIYDFATQSWIQAPTIYQYKRVHY